MVGCAELFVALVVGLFFFLSPSIAITYLPTYFIVIGETVGSVPWLQFLVM